MNLGEQHTDKKYYIWLDTTGYRTPSNDTYVDWINMHYDHRNIRRKSIYKVP